MADGRNGPGWTGRSRKWNEWPWPAIQSREPSWPCAVVRNLEQTRADGRRHETMLEPMSEAGDQERWDWPRGWWFWAWLGAIAAVLGLLVWTQA